MAVYLITGASSGIGEQMARLAVKRGHRVFALARRIDRLEILREDLGEMLVPIACDVTDKARVKEICDGLNELPDVVFLNAGYGLMDSHKAFDIELHERTFAINYFGVLHFVAALFERMKERGSGTFVATSSLAAYRGLPDSAAYGSSKAAISSAFEAMRLTYGRAGLQFLTVHPGFIDTPMTQGNKHPMPFLYTAEKAARCILDGAERGKLNINFPLPMWLGMVILRLLPPKLYRKLVGH